MWARRAEHTFSEPVRVSEFLRESASFSERASLSPRELAPRAPRDCARRGASPRRPTLSSSARRRCSAATTTKRPSSRRRAATSSAQRRSDTDPASHWPGPSLTAGYRIFNTWMGDMTKLLLFRAVLEAAEREGLQARAVSTGAALMRALEAARERRPRCTGSTLPPRPPAARRLKPPVFARGCECTAASCSCTPPSWHPHAEPAPPALRWLSSQPHLSRDAVHTHAVGAAPSRGAQLARRRHHHRL